MAAYLIKRTTSLADDLEKAGVEIEEDVKDGIKRAQRALDESVFLHSIELSKQLIKDIEELHNEHFKKRSEEQLKNIDRIIINAKKSGVRVDEVMERVDDIRRAIAEERFKDALMICDAISNKIDDIRSKSLQNLAGEDQYTSAKADLDERLRKDLVRTKDPRSIGRGDELDNYARKYQKSLG